MQNEIATLIQNNDPKALFCEQPDSTPWLLILLKKSFE